MAHVQQAGEATNLSASGSISLVPGSLIGYHVNSTAGGTIVIRDGQAAGTALNAAATPSVGFNAFPAACSTGCYATIAGTIDVTFFFAAG